MFASKKLDPLPTPAVGRTLRMYAESTAFEFGSEYLLHCVLNPVSCHACFRPVHSLPTIWAELVAGLKARIDAPDDGVLESLMLDRGATRVSFTGPDAPGCFGHEKTTSTITYPNPGISGRLVRHTRGSIIRKVSFFSYSGSTDSELGLLQRVSGVDSVPIPRLAHEVGFRDQWHLNKR